MNGRFWNLWSDDWMDNVGRWVRHPAPAVPPSGSGWKKTWTANPDLLTIDQRVLLYYRGTGPKAGNPEERDQIGVAEVLSIGEAGLEFRDHAACPAIRSGGADAFDADVLDPASIRFGDEVLLYFSALGRVGDSIGMAASPDGVRFGGSQRIMEGRAPTVIASERRLFMLSQEMVGQGYGLRLFTSDDGRTFAPVVDRPVFEPQPGGWDGLSVVTARLYVDGEWNYMIYGGSADSVDEPAYFGLARSRDLVSWQRHPGNPIFGAGARGEPDGGCIWFPALTEFDAGFAMLYEGSRGTPRWGLDCSICMAHVNY